MISLSKVAHHIWFNHPLTPKNKTAKLAMEMGVGEDREEEGWKREGGGVGQKQEVRIIGRSS